MKVSRGSALALLLSIAMLSILSSCASLAPHATTLTPRSEAVCDQAPPSPIPPIGNTRAEIEAGYRHAIGQIRDEVTKYLSGQRCREAVRAENAAAAAAAGKASK
jgi:hypothetical protein